MSGISPPNPYRASGSLVEVLRQYATERPTHVACRFLTDGKNETLTLDYAELDRRVRALAALLAQEGAAGERALLLLPPGPSYVIGFLGCLYAGAIPVPVYPPTGMRATDRVRRISQDADARFVLGDRASQAQVMADPSSLLAQARWVLDEEFDQVDAEAWKERYPGRGDLAFLQYTSGSTSRPKGVMVTHANLRANAEIVRVRVGVAESDVVLSWLPPYHDMGLIGFIMQPIFAGCTMVLMSPTAFVRRPLRWLEAISRFRATVSGAPDFAYALCAEAASESPLELDLSSWRVALSGAEPVRTATIRRFVEAFASAKFDPRAFTPCYGLAEATLFVSGAQLGRGAHTIEVEAAALERGLARVVAADARDLARTLVSCGPAGNTPACAVVDPERRRPCGPGQVGEIWIAGPSVCRGYWRNPEHTDVTFAGRMDDGSDTAWLRTGDLGFVLDGELYVTGRSKDLIIVRGRNLYPQDIEATASASHPGLGVGSSIAFSIDDGAEERLVVIQEVRGAADTGAMIDAIRQAVIDEHGVEPHAIEFIRRGTLPRTSSGKVMRFAARAAFLAGELSTVASWSAVERHAHAPSHEDHGAGLAAHAPPDDGGTAAPAGPTAVELRDWMVRAVAQAAGIPPGDITPGATWSAHGLDSLRLTRLAGQLGDWLGRPLSPTLLYDHPSIDALAEYLATGTRVAMPRYLGQRRSSEEPIAIVGLACRFPGGADAESFFAMLRQGRHAIREVPAGRPGADAWKRTAEQAAAARWAGWLDDIDAFDAGLFSIARREARFIDPQQRLLLEMAWRAFEDAGYPPHALAGSATGVFVGISSSDYARLLVAAGAAVDPYAGTGNALSVAANRVSYCFDLRGPSVAIDTACSSSLVAVHHACSSLRAGECDRALAGGVNALLSPDLSVIFAGAGMLSPDGLARTFDASANGYVRGEGCGFVVLRRLSDALADGDRVLALIRGSAVNQDGRSNGLTAPNGLSQQAVIRAALDQAGVAPADIEYVEAHGTGTALGDPIELAALRAVFCDEIARQRPLGVGSVKTNIGHLEAAAGIAGLIKVVLAFIHEERPAHLHLETPIPLAEPSDALEVSPQARRWPSTGPRLAGVSSFGFGGTNAHVVLESAPLGNSVHASDDHARVLPLLLSARDDAALRQHAGQVAARIESYDFQEFAQACRAAATERTPLAARLTVVADSGVEASRALVSWSEGGDTAAAQARTIAPGEPPPRVAWLFSGQGSQYPGMARALYEREPTFRRWIDRCDAALAGRLGIGLMELLSGSDPARPLEQTRYTQPALFAVEVALAQTLLAWGIRPACLLGHSVGEYAAACVAGVFELEDGLRLIAARGELVQDLPSGGGMLAVAASPQRTQDIVASAPRGRWSDRVPVVVAAINGPERTVLSGRRDHLDRLVQAFEAAGIATRFLEVSHAFHSPLLAPMADAFGEVASAIELRAPHLALISNVTGARIAEEIATPQYWVRHLLEPVRFGSGVQALFADESAAPDVVLEVGPGAALLAMAREALPSERAESVAWLPTLRRGVRDDVCLTRTLGQLFLRNVPVDWSAALGGRPRIRGVLPGYPFDRERHWFPAGSPAALASPRGGEAGNPLLGTLLDLPDGREQRFEARVAVGSPPWIRDHRVGGVAVLPAAAYVELALAAAHRQLGDQVLEVRDLDIATALRITEDEAVLVHTTVTPTGHGCEVRVFSSMGGHAGRWTRHASTQVVPSSVAIAPLAEEANRSQATAVELGALYASLARRGLEYGPAFRGLEQLMTADGEIWAVARVPETQAASEAMAYALHPVLLDAALQALGPLFAEERAALLPVGVDRLVWRARPGAQRDAAVLVHARRGASVGRDRRVDLDLLDASGSAWVLLRGLRLRPFEAVAADGHEAGLADARYVVDWTRRGQPGGRSPRLPSPAGPADVLRAELARRVRDEEIVAYQRQMTALEERAAMHAQATLAELGLDRESESRLASGADMDASDVAALARRLGVAAARQPLLRRMLQMCSGSDGMAAGARTYASKSARARSIPGDESTPEGALLDRCAARLGDVLRGRCDPLTELLFPDGDASELLRIYRDSAGPRMMNELIGIALDQALAALPAGEAVRVLEIGAGTGGTTEGLLRRLPTERTEYIFTDLSPQLVADARRRFSAASLTHEPVAYRSLDIEHDPAAQGIARHGVDVVVAANVLHATADLAVTLAHVRQLLAPGGWLVMLEGTQRLRWLDLTFGLTDGWWRFCDTHRRPDHPLAPAHVWRAALLEAGFDEVFSSTETDKALAQDVIVASVPSVPRRSRHWWVASTRPDGHGPLAEVLQASGATVTQLAADQRLDQDLLPVAAANGAQGAILFADGAAAGETEAVEAGAAAALALIQDALRAPAPVEVCLVTCGAREVGGGVTATGLAGAPLWGMARAVRLEHPELRLRCIDLPAGNSEPAWQALVRELEVIEAEDEVALRADGRWVPRLSRERDATGPTAGCHTPFRLAPEVVGHLDSLRPLALARRAPGPGEVEVRVRATGLNFRDLLQALGALGSGYAGELSLAHMPFGFECSGVVERVGANVTDLAVGDPVIAAFTPGSLASHVTLPAKFVFAKPESLDWAEAAALPTAWFTAWHGLDQLARLAPGERVLIHAAAGGVGSAAVRHALSLGAEVIATAHPRKWSYLHDLGVRRIASSRDASFGDHVLAWTEGRGVDVVLNALSDQLARRSLEVTAIGGRFIDMGRMSGLDGERARELRPDVEYHAFDLGLLAARDNQQIDALLERFADRVASLRLPTRAYPIAEAERAFRDLQAGRHVGKLALMQPALRLDGPVEIRADATYLITGGTGGLGLRVAAWLAEQGATHVALLARHAPDGQARDFIVSLRDRGLNVRLLEADVSDRDSLAAALAQVRSDGRALRGVVHAAGVLDDALVEKLDRRRLRTVLDPKVRGALHLDALTRDDSLDFFVLFSSVAALLGSPGQANHAAANAFLDAFAWHRRASGRPAISLDWGVWAEIGAAARKQAGERMRLVGLGEIDPEHGIETLARALAEAPVQLGVVPIDWSRFHHPLAGRAFFARLERQAIGLVNTAAASVLDLTGLDDEARHQALDRHLRSHIAVVLGLDSPDEIEPRSRLMDLGMDSLMAVELKQRLEHTLGCSLRATLMYDHPTLEALIDHLGRQLGQGADGAPGAISARPNRMDESERPGREITDASDASAAALRAGMLPETFDGFDDIDELSDAEVLERLRR